MRTGERSFIGQVVRFCVLCLFLASLARSQNAVTANRPPGSSDEATDVKLCDLVNHPLNYDRKIVRIRASIMGRELKSKQCAASDTVWLELPDPNVSIADENLSRLTKFMNAYSYRQSSALQCTLVCFQYEVTATFVGQVHARVAAWAMKDPKTGLKQSYSAFLFGPDGLYPVRLVVSQVSNVAAKPTAGRTQPECCKCVRVR